jgi:hypothetical protein
LDEAATAHSVRDARRLDGYRVLADQPDSLGGESGFSVGYAYVESEGGDGPLTVQGLATFVESSDAVLAVIVEADQSAFEAAWPGLDSIRQTVVARAETE